MRINTVIERAEKFRFLGRFDKKSALAYINDALYDICLRQSIKITEEVFEFEGNPIQLTGKVIKVDSIDVGEIDGEFTANVKQNNEIDLYKKDSEGKWQPITFDDNISIAKITIVYTGYVEVTKPTLVIDFPNEFETAAVYFVRSKMLEEIGEIEQSQYFEQQYLKEMLRKSAPKVDVVSKPSKFSLI